MLGCQRGAVIAALPRRYARRLSCGRVQEQEVSPLVRAVRMHDAEQAAAARRRAVVGALAAQACAFLNAVTAVTSESIAVQGVDVPTFQARNAAACLSIALSSSTHSTPLSHAELPELRPAERRPRHEVVATRSGQWAAAHVAPPAVV